MKIVHALGWYFPESLGGTEVYVAALSRHLIAKGHDVLVAAPRPNADREATYEHEGVEVYRYPIPAAPTREEAQGRTPVRGTEKLHRWLERARPDVFHCHSLVTGLGVDEIETAKALGARVILTCHTPGLGFICQRGTMLRWGRELCDGLAASGKCAACDLTNRGLPELAARLVGRLPLGLSCAARGMKGPLGTALGMRAFIAFNAERQRRLLTAVDAFVVLTEWAREAVARNHGSDDKLVLNRLGIELNGVERVERSTGTPVRLGYLGRFEPLKGVLVLAEAVARLPRELPFSLELRGPVVDSAAARTLARVKELLCGDPRVGFADAAGREGVGRVLADYDLLLCPSLCLEGGPTVALEARSVGTPVVGSRIGGLAEIVRDGVDGALVTPGDASALAREIQSVVSDPSVLDRWRAKLEGTRTMRDVALDYLALYAPGA